MTRRVAITGITLLDGDALGLRFRASLEGYREHTVRDGRVDLFRIDVFRDRERAGERTPFGAAVDRQDAVFEGYFDARGVEARNGDLDFIAALRAGHFEAEVPVTKCGLERVHAEKAL